MCGSESRSLTLVLSRDDSRTSTHPFHSRPRSRAVAGSGELSAVDVDGGLVAIALSRKPNPDTYLGGQA